MAHKILQCFIGFSKYEQAFHFKCVGTLGAHILSAWMDLLNLVSAAALE